MESNWDADIFRDEISRLILRFNSVFFEDVVALLSNPNGERKKSVRALASLDIVRIQNRQHAVLAEIEEKIRCNASIILFDNNFEPYEIDSYLSDVYRTGFVKVHIINELNSTLSQMSELTVLAASHLNILESNTGTAGAFRGFLKGFADPIDGISHVFGQGTMQIEVNASVQGFNAALAFVSQSVDAVSNSLEHVVLQEWNRFGAMIENS